MYSYCPAAESAGFRTARDPDVDLFAFDLAARVGHQVFAAVGIVAEQDLGAEFQHPGVGCDDAAADAVAHGCLAPKAICCCCERSEGPAARCF